MPSIFVFAHGGRNSGTSTGTAVIPPGVTVRFFELDQQYLFVNAGLAIAKELVKPGPDFAAVDSLVQETKNAWETIPNYHASGDKSHPEMGVYVVSGKRLLKIVPGKKVWLSEIMHGYTGGGGDIYWLACRDAPAGINVFEHETNIQDLNARRVRPESGKKPSQVKGKKTWL